MEKEITEVTFEVTIRHFVTEDSPNPDELDIESGVERALRDFDIEIIRAKRLY